MRCTSLIAAGLLAVPAAAQTPSLAASSYTDGTVYLIAPDSGQIVGTLGAPGSLPGAQSLTYGPGGDLYVVSEESSRVLRFDGVTLAPLGVFVGDDPLTPEDESGGLSAPTAAVFGPSGDLYVASFDGDSVLRYDGASGAHLGVFVDPGDGNLDGPDAGMTFGPDGLLWVPSFNNNRVLRFDPHSGDFVDKVIGSGTGLRNPRTLRFRSDGTLLVSSWGSDEILHFDLEGNLIAVFASSPRPTGIAFEPGTGHVLVSSDNASFVKRFDGQSGAPLADLVPPGGTLPSATHLAWAPDIDLHLSRIHPGTPGNNSVTVRGATASSGVVLIAGTTTTSLYIENCAPLWLGFDPLVAVAAFADPTGAADASFTLGSALSGTTLRLSAYDLSTCRLSNLVAQTVQ